MKQIDLKQAKRIIDVPLLISTAALLTFGLLIIYDATVVAAFRDFGDKLYYFKYQLIWASLGMIALSFLSLFDYHRILKLSLPILGVSIFLLVLVLIPGIGAKIYGARRWISIGNFTFQPSEFAKLALIFYEAAVIAKFQKYKMRLVDLLIVLFIPALVITGLVLIQPDLGTALIFAGVTIILYFVGNSPLWHFIAAIPLGILAVVASILQHPYRLERLKSFLDPTHDPLGSSYQINQILIALTSGGLLGVGLGGARSKFAFIPEVQSDAIFAVAVEELGAIGALFIIGLFLFLISRGLKIAREAADNEGKYLAMGIVGLIAIQSLFNIASVVALIPLTGIPLPFISHGGSSLFITLASIGILVNIKKQSAEGFRP